MRSWPFCRSWVSAANMPGRGSEATAGKGELAVNEQKRAGLRGLVESGLCTFDGDGDDAVDLAPGQGIESLGQALRGFRTRGHDCGDSSRSASASMAAAMSAKYGSARLGMTTPMASGAAQRAAWAFGR